MKSLKTTLLASAVAFMAAGAANATVITLDGQTFNTSPSPAITSNGGLTFLAQFTTNNQNLDNGPHGDGIITLVEDYLSLIGHTGVLFLGRAGDSSDLPTGDNGVTVTGNGNLTGTWTLHLGSGAPNYTAQFVAIHAGEGQKDDLFEINNPNPNSPLLTGSWATNNGHGLSNFDLFGADPTNVPEPMSLGLLGIGVVGLAFIQCSRRQRV